MVQIQNFSENLEKSFARLSNEIKETLDTPEFKDVPEREVVKESLRSFAEAAPVVQPSPAPSVASPVAPVESHVSQDRFLPSYFSEGDESPEVKRTVEGLIQMVFDEDIEKAVNEAKRYPAFVEDAFHDALVDKLMPELRKRGIVK